VLNGINTNNDLCGYTSICSPGFICGIGIRAAKYTVVKELIGGEFEAGYTSNFTSHIDTYSSAAHRQLGKYLRWYHSLNGINLMPFYNCFTNESTDSVFIQENRIIDGSNSGKYTVWTVPIEFNKSYSIFIDSIEPVYLKSCLLNSVGRVRHFVDGEELPLDELISEQVEEYQSTSYDSPVKYEVTTTNPTLIGNTNNLYLLIQVNSLHSGPIVVLEGTDILTADKIVTSSEYTEQNDSEVTSTVKPFEAPINPSIIDRTLLESPAYTDRLTEFLLQNVISGDDDIRNNIKRVQQKMGINTVSNPETDVWTNRLKFLIYNRYFSYTNPFYSNQKNITSAPIGLKEKHIVRDEKGNIVAFKNLTTSLSNGRTTKDISGYVDKDVENFLFGYREV